MPLLMPNVGEQRMLEKLLAGNATLKLFSNDKTPAETDTAASYTECSGSGYAAKTLTGGAWTITPGNPTVAAYAQQTFTFNATGLTAYGYMVVDATDGVLLWAERFTGAPYVINNAADTIKVTPRLELE